MAIICLIKEFFQNCFSDLCLIGKIIFAPIIIIVCICFIPFIIFEFFLADIFILLISALSKSSSVKDTFDFFLGD